MGTKFCWLAEGDFLGGGGGIAGNVTDRAKLEVFKVSHQAFPVPGVLNAVDYTGQLLHYLVQSYPRMVKFLGLASQ